MKHEVKVLKLQIHPVFSRKTLILAPKMHVMYRVIKHDLYTKNPPSPAIHCEYSAHFPRQVLFQREPAGDFPPDLHAGVIKGVFEGEEEGGGDDALGCLGGDSYGEVEG